MIDLFHSPDNQCSETESRHACYWVQHVLSCHVMSCHACACLSKMRVGFCLRLYFLPVSMEVGRRKEPCRPKQSTGRSGHGMGRDPPAKFSGAALMPDAAVATVCVRVSLSGLVLKFNKSLCLVRVESYGTIEL